MSTIRTRSRDWKVFPKISPMIRAIVQLMRPHQYVKNGFVMLGVVFSHRWDHSTLLYAGCAFIAFCVIASAVYTLNDILDVESDRQHPIKCTRPIARGAVSVRAAWMLLVVLAMLAFTLAARVSPLTLIFVATYAVFNIAYSWRLKHIVILDVFLISSGFMLRILAGTLGIGINPSQWLLLCGFMLTLFLGFSKRRAELLMLEKNGNSDRTVTRRVLNDYSAVMLEQFITVGAACTILSYGLYTMSPDTVQKHGSMNLIYTLPLVIYGMFRYLFLLHHLSRANDTARDLFADRHLLITVLAWLGLTIGILA